MTRRPNLKLLETAMTTTELAATMPAVVESSTQRLAWSRDIANAKDERGLIDMQIESVRRTAEHARDEADQICIARVGAANSARDRELSDIAKVETAGVQSLQSRQSDIDRMIAGFEAAMAATS